MNRLARAIFLFLIATVTATCGKSYSHICSDTCSRVGACVGGNQQSVMNCQANCSGQDYNPDHCTTQSLNDKYACIDHCNGYADCNQWLSCLAGCPGCVKQ